MEVTRVALALWRGWRLVALVVVLSALLGAVLAKTVVGREYRSEVVLEWEAQPSEGDADPMRELQTTIDGVKLTTNLAAVREKLGRTSTLMALGAAIEVHASPESNIVTIAGNADEAEDAAALARTTVEVFLEHRLQLERHRRQEAVDRRNDDVKVARKNLDAARSQFDDFRKQHGLSDFSVESQSAIEQVAALQAKAQLARAEARAEQAKRAALQQAVRNSPSTLVLSEKEEAPAAKRLAQARSELAGLRSQLSDDHPKVQALQAEVDALEAKRDDPNLVTRSERTVGRNPIYDSMLGELSTANARLDAASSLDSTYTELAKEAERRVATLSRNEGQAAKLLAEVRVAEKRLAALVEAEAEARAELAGARSGFRVLADARVPALPSKSMRKPVAVAVPMLGALAALMFVLARAFYGLRVQSANELSFWSGMPVVASSVWPGDETALDDLVSDLISAWSGAGRTVVWGIANGGPHAEPLVEALALALGDEAGGVSAVPHGTSLSSLRRQCRTADRVLVLVSSDQHSLLEVRQLPTRIGRKDGCAIVLIGLDEQLAAYADQAGDVAAFWRASASTFETDGLVLEPSSSSGATT